MSPAFGFKPAWNAATALRSHRIHKKSVIQAAALMKQASNEAATQGAYDEADDIRYVVSTGCSAYQHWQVECQKASFKKLKQRGKYTHIVVGCETSQESTIHTSGGGDSFRTVLREEWEKSSNPDVDLFFVPAVAMAKEFPWFNKPWSFYQWAANTTIKETTVVIMDPDQFFIEAIDNTKYKLNDLRPTTDEWALKTIVKDMSRPAMVTPGTAVAQTYGLGSGWTNAEMFDRAKICGANSYCATVTAPEAWAFYSVGPPYFLVKCSY
jgi:hypothetical protein